MKELRRARLQSVILEKMSVFVRDVKDPRVPDVTFTRVEVTPDAEQAIVYVTILGGAQGGFDGAPPLSEKGAKQRMKDCIAGLSSASGFLRRQLARELDIRHIPALIFKEDRGLENVNRVHELLREISPGAADESADKPKDPKDHS